VTPIVASSHQMTRTRLFTLLFVPLAAALSVGAIGSFLPGAPAILAFLLGAMTLVAWLVTVVVRFTKAALRRNWRDAATLVAAIGLAFPSTILGMSAGDYIHLAILYPYYLARIDPNSKEAIFPWGDEAVSAIDSSRFRSLVYDVSGQTAEGERRNGDARITTSHLVGRFYIRLVDFP
jgi:hypothetical protein